VASFNRVFNQILKDHLMKLSEWTQGARLFAFLIIGALAVAGCGDGDGSTPQEVKSAAVTLDKKYKDPPGADPSVPAEQGGKGFETIAADSGWKTTSLTPTEFRYIADSNAKKGGEITTAIDEYPATFRAYGRDENAEATRAIYNLVYEPLLGINPLNLDFLPALATHWKIGPDNQTYYFRINPDARFSDGHPVTSEDVLATYKLGLDSTILEPYTNTFFAGFDPPVAISKYIVSVRSKTNNWKNMFYFAGRPILPAHVIGTMSGKDYLDKYQYEMPPGTGPYVVMSPDIKKGNSVTLTRRADWWGAALPENRGRYNFDKIRLTVVRDDRLLLEKFKKGELDLYPVNRASYWVEEFKFDEAQRGLSQKVKVYNNNPVGFGGIAFNTKRAPFNDPKIRKAFTLLFNRADLVAKLMFNEYDLSDSYYPSSDYSNPRNPKQEFSPEKAAAVLTEAGYGARNNQGILTKGGKPLVVEMLVTQDQVRIVTPYQQDLKQAGIQVNFRVVDATTRFKMVSEKNYTMTFQQWGGIIYPNPISSFHSRLADAPNTNNITALKNARIDQICEREQVTFDRTERIRLLQELDGILVAENHYALGYHVPYVRVAYWNKFGHPDFILTRIEDWDDAFALWWFEPEKAATVAKGMRDKSVKMPLLPEKAYFWQEYNKSHPTVATTATPAATDSAKPATK
jgi:microcin C transport system substrate-binding protein